MQKGFARLFGGFLMCCATILISSGIANAQFKAALQATVSDSASAAVVGATVVLTNNENSREVQTVTSETGFYRFNGPAPGGYKIAVTLANSNKKPSRITALLPKPCRVWKSRSKPAAASAKR